MSVFINRGNASRGPMKTLVIKIVLSFLAMSAAAAGQTASTGTSATPNQQSSNAAQQSVMAASSSLRILSPTVGEKIGSTSLDVRYELTDSGADAAPSPNYRLQLDGRDPVETLDTEYNFTGLAPGAHTLTLELVDANHTPINGSQTVVHFNTFTPGAAGSSSPAPKGPTSELLPPRIVKARMPLPASNPVDQLPAASGELPLLSMLGFGVLVGGVISAMRTRKP